MMAKNTTNKEKKVASREIPTCDTIEVLLVPQCVGCPHNKGAISCDIFGEKPSQYMANIEDCPREKKN